MTDWSMPLYSRGAVDRAARTLVDPTSSASDHEIALSIVNNWRSSHAFPLNTLQMNLRRRIQPIDPDATVAQRIKRLPSIVGKLERFDGMNLSRMQDIGGARAVLADINAVRDARDLYLGGNGKHSQERYDDYIDLRPKESGYRGVHLIYKYRSDRKATYNGLRVELQLRTRLQHAWATAVETVGFFTLQALKSSQGGAEWLRFFALMSSEIARMEGTTLVPGTPTDHAESIKELRALTKSLGVIDRLNAYGATLQHAEETIVGGKQTHFILRLDAESKELTVYSFSNLRAATDQYEGLERAAALEKNTDVVLVSVDSLTALRRAYPNYFLDTAAFVQIVERAIV